MDFFNRKHKKEQARLEKAKREEEIRLRWERIDEKVDQIRLEQAQNDFWNDRNQAYRSVIQNHALPALVKCVNEHYDPSLCLGDLEIEFSVNVNRSSSHGDGKIVFQNHYHKDQRKHPVNPKEYKMYDNDHDLHVNHHLVRTSEHHKELRTNYDLAREFHAWWLAAHELAHEVVDRITKKCTNVFQPIIPNIFAKLELEESDWPWLVDLLKNQAWWKAENDHYDSFTLCYHDAKVFYHGVFYQHIYRTLRREVVNPMFGIPVREWNQKPKPKKYPWSMKDYRHPGQWFITSTYESVEKFGPAMTESDVERRSLQQAELHEKQQKWKLHRAEKREQEDERKRQKRDAEESAEIARRQRLMNSEDGVSNSSLMESIKSEVHNEQNQSVRDLINMHIVPKIKNAVEDGDNSVVIFSRELANWDLIYIAQNGDYDEWQFPPIFQRFEYHLIDENLKLNYYQIEDDGDWGNYSSLKIKRDLEVNYITNFSEPFVLEIEWD